MIRFVVSFGLLLTATAQLSKDAKILKEQRFNAGDGRFGSAFAQEDGTVYREETTADGERIGQYSYVDRDGQTITVKYSAGKDGFRILEGSHVPEGATGLNSAPFNPDIAANSFQEEPNQPVSTPLKNTPRQPLQPAQPAASPKRKAVRRRLPIQPRPVTRQSPVSQNNQEPRFRQPLPVTSSKPKDANFNPFINPADPTHQNLQFNTNAADFAGNKQPGESQRQSQPRQQASFPSAASVPNCADCGGVNPFVNPADSSHQQLFRQQNIAAVQPARQQVPQSFQPAPQSFQPAQQSFQPAQQSFNNFQPTQQNFQSPQQPIQPAQQTFQSAQQSFQPLQQSFQPAQQSFQPTQQNFPSPQQSFQSAQQAFQPTQQAFQPTQQAFQSPQQPQQETILPAFLEQQSQQPQQFSPQQQFQQPLQFQPNSAQNTDFQGQLSLDRFQSGFNFDFSA